MDEHQHPREEPRVPDAAGSAAAAFSEIRLTHSLNGTIVLWCRQNPGGLYALFTCPRQSDAHDPPIA